MRPLMLVEVTRKIWAGLLMKKVARLWEKHKLISPNMPT